MLNRPHTLDGIKGHEEIKKFLLNKIKSGTFPQFLILNGDEGLGKTAMADILALILNYGVNQTEDYKKAATAVIDNSKTTDCIKKFNMAKDSGKDTAKEVLSSLNSSLSSTGKMVVICDECHNMSEAAQDVFLVDTEYLNSNTYLIMCTTDKSKLKPTLLSRALVINLSKLKLGEMKSLLNEFAAENVIQVPNPEITLRLVAEWADFKPRAALTLLQSFRGEQISDEILQSLMGYVSVADLIPIISGFSSNMIHGIAYISSMQIGDNIPTILVELLKIRMGGQSSLISMKDQKAYHEIIMECPERSLQSFTSQVCKLDRITREKLSGIFIESHRLFNTLTTISDSAQKREEIREVMTIEREVTLKAQNNIRQKPTLAGLLNNGDVLKGGE